MTQRTDQNVSPTPLHKPRVRSLRHLVWFALMAGAAVLAGTLASWELKPANSALPLSAPLTAKMNGKETFTLFPGGEFTAGKRDGLMILLAVPVGKLRGSFLSVAAINEATGELIRVADRVSIDDTNRSGGKTRVTVSDFGVPYAGQWRIEVKLNGELFGQVVMNVPEFPWEISPVFTYGDLQLRGQENIVGIQVAGNASFRAGRRSRLIWHLWGSQESLTGSVRVIAVSKDSGKRFDAFPGASIDAPSGSFASFPSLLVLPDRGLWRLTLLVEGRVFGSVVVEAL